MSSQLDVSNVSHVPKKLGSTESFIKLAKNLATLTPIQDVVNVEESPKSPKTDEPIQVSIEPVPRIAELVDDPVENDEVSGKSTCSVIIFYMFYHSKL